MARGVNKCILVGNLGRDPDIRHTQNGKTVATLSVATTEKWMNREGKKQESTEWHRVIAWEKLAEVCEKYLRKGKQVYVEGKLQHRTWDDDKGAKRHTTEIVASTIVMLGPKGEAAPLEDQLFGPGEGDKEGEPPF